MSSGAVRVGLTLENRAVDTEETREGILCRDRGWGSGKLRGWSSKRQERLREFRFSGPGFQDKNKAGRVVLVGFCSSSLAGGELAVPQVQPAAGLVRITLLILAPSRTPARPGLLLHSG